MNFSLIVAMDSNRGIGKDNDLMWHLPAEMRFFTTTTKDQIVVMGRKNYDSIPEKYRPLPNRENVILSRNSEFDAGDCKVFTSLNECVEHFSSETERKLFVIGGGQIYREALTNEDLNEMFITYIDHAFEPDTFFSKFDETVWNKEEVLRYEADEKNPHGFTVYRYWR
jgi:dihydrofolate reductase